MATIFGDFVFKITAPVKDAIRNVKMWDKEMTISMKNRKKEADEEKKNMTFLQSSWQSFSKAALTSFAAFSSFVMINSPHIRAAVSIIGLHMRMLAMDIGKTWAPAFKEAEMVVGDLVKAWREWGSVKEGASTEKGSAGGFAGTLGFSESDVENMKTTIHDFVNTLLGIVGAVGVVATAGQVLFKVWGGEGSVLTLFKSFGPAISGFLSGISATFIAWVAAIVAIVYGMVVAWNENFMGMKDTVARIWDGIQNIFGGAIELVTNLVGGFFALINGDTEAFGKAMYDAWMGLGRLVWGIWETITGAIAAIMTGIARVAYGVINVINDILIQPAINWGRDIINNLWEGIQSMGSWFQSKVESAFGWIADIFSFDIQKNDKMAQKWGKDMVVNFAKGTEQGGKTIINQNVVSNLSINNTSMNQLDSYGLAGLTSKALNQQYAKIKAIGGLYY